MRRPFSTTLLFLLTFAAHAADWAPVAVPGPWEEKGPPAARSLDGVVWYRAWLKPAPAFFNVHERNLYEESVTLNLSDVADAHEAYVNGVRIGAGGTFPPNFESGRGDRHAHKVPVGTLKKDRWNEIAIRVYNRSGPGGFLGEAPSIMTYNLECLMEGTWQFLAGEDYTPGGALETQPTTASFSQFRSSSRVLGRAKELVTGPRFSPEDSFAK